MQDVAAVCLADHHAPGEPSASSIGVLLAISSAGGHVDICAWPRAVRSPPRTEASAASAESTTGDGLADSAVLRVAGSRGGLAAWHAGPPLWLQSLLLPPPVALVQRSDRQNAWTALCWVQRRSAAAGAPMATLLTGALGGGMTAWRLDLRGGGEAWRSRVALGAAGALASPAASAGSGGAWKRKPAIEQVLTAVPNEVAGETGPSRMLFSIHIDNGDREVGAADDGTEASPIRAVTTSLDRTITCWAAGQLHGSADAAAAALKVQHSWHGTGAAITAICAEPQVLARAQSQLSLT